MLSRNQFTEHVFLIESAVGVVVVVTAYVPRVYVCYAVCG